MNSELKRCSRCILPSTLSTITFDEEGVCNHCRKYEKDFHEWDQIKDRKEAEFRAILEKARTLKRPYDCLVPLSGGKDSTYALYLCTKVYNLRTLAVTLDNGYLSVNAKENIRNALASCNADHIFYSISKDNASELFNVFTRKTGDFCNACMRGINYSIESSVRNYRIPVIVRGSGRRVQYVSQIREVSSLNTASYFARVIRKTDAEGKFGHFAAHRHTMELQKIAGGICDILGIKRTFLMRYVPQYIGMYDYVYKPFPEIVAIIKKEMRWSDFSGSVEHLDCELHGIPFYKDTLKIADITPKTFHRSGLIRQGLLTREEAMRQEQEDLKKKDPPAGLLKFLSDNHLSIAEYSGFVINNDKARYESGIQKAARYIYHRFRKY